MDLKSTAVWSAAKCRECGAKLDRHTLARLEREAERQHRRVLLMEKKAFEKRLAALKAEHKKALGKLIDSNKRDRARSRGISEEMARQQKIVFDQDFLRLRNAYQLSLEALKQAHSRENALVVDELKTSFNSYIDAFKAQFDELGEGNRTQLQELRAWLEQELPATLLGHIEQLDGPNILEDNVERLASEISKRDAQVAEANEKIKELEARLASRQGRGLWRRAHRDARSEPYKEEPPTDPQQEILEIIREIARERERINGPREETDAKNPIQHFAESVGSKVSSRLRS